MAQMSDDIAELRVQLATARAQFDAFVVDTRAKTAAARSTHNAVMAENKENLAKAQEAFQQVKVSEGTAAAQADQDRQEAIRLEGELGMLREKRNVAADRRAQLAREIEALRAEVRNERQALDLQRFQTQKAVDECQRFVSFYQDRLGLKLVKSTDGNLTFMFYRVFPAQPSEICSFALRLTNDGKYELVTCDPPVLNASALVDELNKTNNLSKFVRDMRKGFRSSARS